MKCFVAVLGACLVWAGAQAQIYNGAYNGAKQEARNASGTITARENQAVAEPTPASPSPNAPAPDPVLQATLRNIASLRADLAGLGNAADTNAAATPRQMLQNDLAAAAMGAKPPSTTVVKLADDLAKIVAGNRKLLPQHQPLAQYLHAVFNGSHLTAAQLQTISANVQKILQDAAVPADPVTDVVNDLKAIAAATK